MAPRNPFDTAVKPGRSLFDRIEEPRRGGRSRSRSPGAPRRSNVSKPPPVGVDRYVPGDRDDGRRRRRSRTRSPPPRRRRSPLRGGRGGGPRRDRDTDGHMLVGGRPRKTQEELDKEMDDYWGSKANGAAVADEEPKAVGASAPAPVMVEDEDEDFFFQVHFID